MGPSRTNPFPPFKALLTNTRNLSRKLIPDGLPPDEAGVVDPHREGLNHVNGQAT